ncbi:MAG: DUF2961 domain-containing protein [Planctomycetota bacterium]
MRLSRRLRTLARRFPKSALLAIATAPWLAGAGRAEDPLSEIARAVEGRTRRASSGLFDPESNRDAWHLAPGERATLTELDGPGEIRHIWFTIAGQDRRYPRNLVLRMYWDGSEVPSVETPIGDFFAAGHGMRANVNSAPLQVTSYGRALNCYWRMPFHRKARVELENQGPATLTVYWQIDWSELPRLPEGSLYFHARYRQEFPPKPFSPYVIFEGCGEGHYVGTVLSVQTSFGSWFGEADDRFYVDGEEEPSIVGTGTEDYFLDAWNLRLFSNANTGVTIKEPNAEDCRFTGYRWHIRPPVTFRKSLRVEFERRSFCEVADPATEKRTLYDFKYRPDFCSSVAFWYQTRVADPGPALPAAEERIDPEIVLETADLAGDLKTSPGVRAYRASNRVCHLKRVLQVDCERAGGWVEVPCRIGTAGRYSISVFQCLSVGGGTWKVTLRGPGGEIELDPALDFYDWLRSRPENMPENLVYGTWLERKLGIHRLVPGDYAFRFECVGSHPLSRARGGGAGLECRLDGISLRRLRWDDLAGWMARYLVEEEELFRGRAEEAKARVLAIASEVERCRREFGAYPARLEDLPLGVGRDPWGQLYRFEAPGRFNPSGFDVYSVRGDSRNPAAWIGNWPDPYRIEGALEGEDLEVRARSAATTDTVQELSLGEPPPLSGRRLRFVRFRGDGDWIEFALPSSLDPGARRLRLRLVASWDYGIVVPALNGAEVSAPVDAYAPRPRALTLDAGTVEVRAGENVLRITAARRNPRSRGSFAGLDAVILEPPAR